MEKFIQSCLEELRSLQETKNLIGGLSSRITDHRGRVRELLSSEPLRHPEVILLIMVGLAVDRPLESNFFPGLLEGLLGSLGIAAPGEGNPPTSSREGADHMWSTAVHEAVSQIEQRDAETPEAVGLPPNLDLHYKEGFLETQRHLIPPVFSDPLFIPTMAKAVFELAKHLVVLKVLPPAHCHGAPSAPPQPESGGPEQGVLKSGEPIPSTSQSTPPVQEQISEASDTDSDSDGADEPPPEKEPPRRTLKVRFPLKLLKRGHQNMTSSSKDGVTPSKVWKEPEVEEAEVGTLTGPYEAALQKAWYELFQKNLPEVQEVRAQILQEGEVVTKQVLDSSPAFCLRWAADETHQPAAIGEHWIDHLDAGGHIAKCNLTTLSLRMSGYPCTLELESPGTCPA